MVKVRCGALQDPEQFGFHNHVKVTVALAPRDIIQITCNLSSKYFASVFPNGFYRIPSYNLYPCVAVSRGRTGDERKLVRENFANCNFDTVLYVTRQRPSLISPAPGFHVGFLAP